MTTPTCDCATCQALPDRVCSVCDARNYHTSYLGPEANRMKERGECWPCAFWGVRAEQKHDTVIDNVIYTPGTATAGPFRGMGGRRFDIEYFDGRRVTTFDLWAGSEIPERYRSRIPNTARFLNGAARFEVNGITCWDESVDPARDALRKAGAP